MAWNKDLLLLFQKTIRPFLERSLLFGKVKEEDRTWMRPISSLPYPPLYQNFTMR